MEVNNLVTFLIENNMFILTLRDIVALIFLGLTALVILIIGLIALFNKIKGWWNN